MIAFPEAWFRGASSRFSAATTGPDAVSLIECQALRAPESPPAARVDPRADR